MRLTVFQIVTGLLYGCCALAQTDTELRNGFDDWIARSAFEVKGTSINDPSTDLEPISEMIGDAKIIALSESLHAAAEPVVFRNRLFKYLVEKHNVKAITIESGLAESKALNDYVLGFEDDLDESLFNGFSHRFDLFQGNRSLLAWMREYNDSLPTRGQKVQIFGLDVSGSPPGIGATRKPDTAIRQALTYLQNVDPDAAEIFRNRVKTLLPILASGNGYGTLNQSERDALTAAIEDMISLIQRRQAQYISASNEYNYRWAERSAIAARQTDAWFRRMPLEWTPAGDYGWTAKSQNIRDRVMADNMAWVLDQLDLADRVFVFASVNHIAAEQHQWPDYLIAQGQREQDMIPFGYYAKANYKENFINIFNIVGNGNIKFCGQPASSPIPVEAPRTDWIDAKFHGHNLGNYFIDLREAPEEIAQWLAVTRDNRNARLSATGSFDLVYYQGNVTHDCLSDIDANERE